MRCDLGNRAQAMTAAGRHAKCRWDYAPQATQTVYDVIGISERSVVADIGATLKVDERTIVILVEDHGRYLLMQEAKPEISCPWCCPAGGVEPGESIGEAVARETLEETGLTVEPRALMRIWHVIPSDQDVHSPEITSWVHVVVA